MNDINTLNGALQELGETMADNLVAKGVTASASDGLTTLAGKILDIQTGGSCYHIAFSEASYTAVGGSATLEIYLQENYAPKSGATVTVTGSDSSVYNGITNTNGIASVTVSDISADTTFTASYSNVSAVCTVTVPSYLIYDDCSSASGLSNYGDNVKFERNPSTTLTFNTDEYVFAGSTCCFGGREILAMHGVNNAKLRIKFKLNTTSSGAYNQFCIFCTDQNVDGTGRAYPYGCRVRNDKQFQYFTIQNESTLYTHSAYYSSAWYYLEAEKDGTSWTIRLYDSSLSLLKENTRTLSSMTNPNWYIALLADKGTNYSVHIKEVLAEAL